MSYQGFYQILCQKGHLEEVDCYDYGFCDNDWRCHICKSKMVWKNSVNTTNGSYDELITKKQLKFLRKNEITEFGDKDDEVNNIRNFSVRLGDDGYWYGQKWLEEDKVKDILLWKAKRIDGYIKLKEKEPNIYCTCQTCGHPHLISPVVYQIPKKGRIKNGKRK